MLKIPIISAPPPFSSPVKGEEVRACRTAFLLPSRKGRLGGILKQEGYTLVEVLVALGILGFGLLAVATMQVTAIKTNARASSLSHGTTLAQAKAEELMNLTYSSLVDLDADKDGSDEDADNDGIDDDGGNFGLNDTVDGGGNVIADDSELNVNGGYNIYWNVAVDEPAANSARVRVIVTWTERGINKRVSLDFVQSNLS
jgi:prepilin-type N-terminal cleavage/methylation domain-containing protein